MVRVIEQGDAGAAIRERSPDHFRLGQKSAPPELQALERVRHALGL